MKLKVQAQHLQIGDITGSGETIKQIIISSTKWPSSKICVVLGKEGRETDRASYWGKYTEINVERNVTPLAWS